MIFKKIKIGTLLLALSSLIMVSCTKTTNNGPVITRVLDIQYFEGVKMSSSENIVITQGSNLKVTAIGNENIVDKVVLDVSNNIWNAHLEPGSYSNYELRYEITIPTLNYTAVSGSGNITVKNFTAQNHLTADISGSGNIGLINFEGAGTISARISGSGNILTSGTSTTFDELIVAISGSGNYIGFPITANKANITISGSGDCETTVTDKLHVKISGSGDVRYKGQPTITTNISGSGDLIDAN